MILNSFIVFEGLDGTGTSTQLQLLKDKIDSSKAWFTAEPTDLETGIFLRKILQSKIKVTPQTSAYLFAADRNEHIYSENGIISHLNKNQLVFSDRYLFSSLAYQSLQCGEKLPVMLNSEFPLPEYLFFFDIEPKKSLERVISRSQKTGEQIEIFEKLDIQEKTYTEYHKILNFYQTQTNDKMNIIIIDASKSIEEIHQNIWSIIKKMPILNM